MTEREADIHDAVINDSDGSEYDSDALADRVHASVLARLEEQRKKHQTPAAAYNISKELYEKAQKHQDQLTDADRELLLSRGDLVGQALAQPSSLTEAERNTVLNRPSPDAVRAGIELASQGKLSTVDGLVAKARADIESLNEAELELLSCNFRENASQFLNNFNDAPGASEASELLVSVEEREAIIAAGNRHLHQMVQREEAQVQVAEERQRNKDKPERDQSEKELREYQALRRQEMDLLLANPDNLDEDELKRQVNIKRARMKAIRDVRDSRLHPYSTTMRPFQAISSAIMGAFSAIAGTGSGGPVRTHGRLRGPYFPTEPGARVPKSDLGFYTEDHREKVVEENPGISEDSLNEIMKAQWEAMTRQEQVPYEIRAVRDYDECRGVPKEEIDRKISIIYGI